MPNTHENHNFSPAKCLENYMCTEDKAKESKSSHYLGALMEPLVLVRRLNPMEDSRIAPVPLTCMMSQRRFLSPFFLGFYRDYRQSIQGN